MSLFKNPAITALENKPTVAFLQVIYCDQTCQKTHWFAHKKICKHLKDIYEKQQVATAKGKNEEENSMYMKTELMLLLCGEGKDRCYEHKTHRSRGFSGDQGSLGATDHT